MNFRKGSKGGGGGGVISDPKHHILQISLYIEDIFDSKIIPKRANVDVSPKNRQYDFPKMRGGVKGRLERFRKFIRFGSRRHPLGGGLTQSKRILSEKTEIFSEFFAKSGGGPELRNVTDIG